MPRKKSDEDKTLTYFKIWDGKLRDICESLSHLEQQTAELKTNVTVIQTRFDDFNIPGTTANMSKRLGLVETRVNTLETASKVRGQDIVMFIGLCGLIFTAIQFLFQHFSK